MSPIRAVRPPSPLVPLLLTLAVVVLLLVGCGEDDPVGEPVGPAVTGSEEAPGGTTTSMPLADQGVGGTTPGTGEPGAAAGGSGTPEQEAVTPGGQVGGPTDDVEPPGEGGGNTPGLGDD